MLAATIKTFDVHWINAEEAMMSFRNFPGLLVRQGSLPYCRYDLDTDF